MTHRRGPLPTRVRGLALLPPAFHETLDSGLAALSLQLAAEGRAAIEGHVQLLLAWNEAINLTAIREPEAIARLHVLDSLAAVGTLRAAGVTALLDLGSGGGFPGIPLASVLKAEALLVDGVAKKARFLGTAAQALGLAQVRAVATRAETLAADPAQRERWPAVTVRAVGPLGDLVELAFPLLRVDGLLVAWKRGAIDAELRAAEAAIEALGGGRVSVVSVPFAPLTEHRLVVVRKAGRTTSGWPRDPAARRRRPW